MGDREILETCLNSASKNTSETDIFPHGTKSVLASVIHVLTFVIRELSATQLLDLDSCLCCAFRFIFTVMFFDGKVTVQVTSALFWDITQRTVVFPHRRLGTTSRYHLLWSGIYVLESVDP